jgi:hypothetical protein
MLIKQNGHPNLYIRKGKRKDTYYMKFERDGKVVSRNITDPTNPKRLPKTKTEAIRFLTAHIASADAGEVEDATKDMQFSDYVNNVYAPSLPQGRGYANTMNLLTHITKYFKGKTLAEVAGNEIGLRSFRDHYLATKSTTTARHYVTRLKAILNHAVKRDVLTERQNYARFISKPPRAESKIVPFPAKWEDAILQTCTDLGYDEFRALLIAYLETGARKEELMRKMLVRDVNLSEGYIRPSSHKRGCKSSPEPKYRITPLSPRAQEAFAFLIQGKSPDEPVYSYNNSRTRWENVRDKAAEKIEAPALAKYRLGDLRKIGITRLNARLNNPAVVMKMTGHSDLSMQLHYQQVEIQTLREQLAKAG